VRAFLGITFTYAGLQKLADHNFFTSSAPSSIQTQLHAYARHSPIQGILAFSSHHAVLVGLLIAFGELAVGVGCLLGLWLRAAAIGGIALAASFLLAISWHSRPYYTGADVVFLFAWIPIALAANRDTWTVDRLLRDRERRSLRLGPAGAVLVDFVTIRTLCGKFDQGRCRAQDGAPCQASACPVLANPVRLRPDVAADLGRRTFLAQASVAAKVAAGAVAAGGVVAIAGRVLAPDNESQPTRADTSSSTTGADPQPGTTTAGQSPATTAPPAAPGPNTTAAGAGVPKGATTVAKTSDVPVGGAVAFRDPRSGDPGWVVQPTTGHFVAFDATCTHQGCPVQFQSDGAFVCPCHGAAFDTRTGSVLQGPARRPLATIKVGVAGDQVYVE
jgi:thiosulfate dehydrogenase [quinone] large subunit